VVTHGVATATSPRMYGRAIAPQGPSTAYDRRRAAPPLGRPLADATKPVEIQTRPTKVTSVSRERLLRS